MDKLYEALTPLLNSGEWVATGGKISLGEKQAQELLACGAVAIIADEEGAPKTKVQRRNGGQD